MGRYKLEEIAAIQDSEGSVICMECATAEEMTELTEDEIIETKEVEETENFIFCDRCKKRITA
jgi:hypothetical protein